MNVVIILSGVLAVCLFGCARWSNALYEERSRLARWHAGLDRWERDLEIRQRRHDTNHPTR